MGQTLDRRPAGEGHLPRLPWMSGSVCRWGDVSYGAEATEPLIKAGGSPPYPQIGWDEDAEAHTDRADSGLHPGGTCLHCPTLGPSTKGVAGGGRLQGQQGHPAAACGGEARKVGVWVRVKVREGEGEGLGAGEVAWEEGAPGGGTP